MKKFIFAMTLVFAIQSTVWAAPVSGLKAIYNDYVYATTVEWDQVNQEQISAINSAFAEDLSALMENGQLTEASLKEFFHSEVSAGRVPEEVMHQILTPAGEINIERLSEVLKTQQENLHMSGANWNGAASLFKVVAWSFIPALIIISIITSSGRKDLCTQSSAGYGFHEPYPCN